MSIVSQKTLILFLVTTWVFIPNSEASSSKTHKKPTQKLHSFNLVKNQQKLKKRSDPNFNQRISLTTQPRTSAKPAKNQWAINGYNLDHASCLRKDFFTEDEMISWLNRYAQNGPEPIAETRVNGVHFFNESPLLIQLFTDLVNSHQFNFKPENGDDIPFSSSCTKVICAAEDVFGRKIGIQLLYMLGRFGVNGSHMSNDRAETWYPDELDEVLLAFAAYPEFMHRQYYNLPFVHYSRNLAAGDSRLGRQIGDASGLFSEWNLLSRADKFITVAHEKAHHFGKIQKSPENQEMDLIGRLRDFDNRPEWYTLSGWTSKDQNTQIFDLGPFHLAYPHWVPSIYGRTNPREDFAESILKYRFDPQGFLSLLGENGRPKYDYIRKNIFKGVEFLKEEDCAESFQSNQPTSNRVSPPIPSPEPEIPPTIETPEPTQTTPPVSEPTPSPSPTPPSPTPPETSVEPARLPGLPTSLQKPQPSSNTSITLPGHGDQGPAASQITELTPQDPPPTGDPTPEPKVDAPTSESLKTRFQQLEKKVESIILTIKEKVTEAIDKIQQP